MIQKIFDLIPLRKRFDSYLSAKISSRLQKERINNLERLESFRNNLLVNLRVLEWDSAVKAERSFLLKHLFRDTHIKCYTDSNLCKMIYMDQFESEEIDFVKKGLKEGDVFVDIGSNIGIFSLVASQIVGKNGKVIAFEPTPETFKRLEENISLNNIFNIDAFQLGISNSKKDEILSISQEGFDAWNSFTKPSKGERFNKVTIKTDSLDNLATEIEYLSKASLIKIDVEGWESMVISGAENLLTKNDAPMLMVEFTEQNAINAGSSTKILYNKIVQFGYRLYRYDYKNIMLIHESYNGPYPYDNLIALKNKHLNEIGIGLIDDVKE
jgi:FkbM family methyltransferase